MIEKHFEAGTFSIFNHVLKRDVPIKLIVTAYDVDPQDWKPSVDPRTGEVLPGKPQTIGELKQHWGQNRQISYYFRFNKKEVQFQFDYSPWAHLPDETYIVSEWVFEEK